MDSDNRKPGEVCCPDDYLRSTPPKGDLWWRVSTLAARLDLSTWWVYNEIKCGRLATCGRTRKGFILSREAVREWMLSRLVAPNPPHPGPAGVILSGKADSMLGRKQNAA